MNDSRKNGLIPTHPGRVFRFCPGCGSPGLSLVGGRSLSCAGCGFTYYLNAAAAVAALIEDPDRGLLLTRRACDPGKGTLDLPGGFVDLAESAEQTLAREVQEELNLEVISSRFLGTFPNTYLYRGITYFTLDLAFECEVKDFNTLRAGDDAQECLFVRARDIRLEDIGLDSIRNMVARYVRRSIGG
ncbi:MAG: NUDIX domain-containing protein [Desulfomonilia bacterium]|jgi:ADP-ribose pyrophosphatase YjhB (NUDIX family)